MLSVSITLIFLILVGLFVSNYFNSLCFVASIVLLKVFLKWCFGMNWYANKPYHVITLSFTL